MNNNNKLLALIVITGLVFTSIASAALPYRLEVNESSTPGSRVDRILGENLYQRIETTRDRSPQYRESEIIVKFKNNSTFRRINLPTSLTVESALNNYRQRSDVVSAEPNYIAHTFYTPNDPYYSLQWNLDNNTGSGINTEEAWNISKGQGVTIAVIDTGIAYENYGSSYQKAPDLANTCFVSGYDFANNDSHPNDDNGHGTHVAGTIAQSTNNNSGASGVAFQSCLMPIKVLNSQGSGSYADIADGIRYAADHGAKVINLSLGGPVPTSYLEDALAYAYGKGVTIIAAAGNDGANTISYPAAYNDYVIAVGATRYDKTLSSYSNHGAGIDLVAPGGDLNVDQNGDGYGDGILQQTFGRTPRDFGYWFFQGTSMATPHVVGAAALVIANGNATTPAQVQQALQETATDLGSNGWDNTYGWGLINAYAALNWSSGTTPPPPPPTNNPPIANAGPDQTAIVNTQLNFSGASSTDDESIASYAWTFGDGGNANGASVSHVYNSTGTFTVTLTVTDNKGLQDSDTASVQITEAPSVPPPPTGPQTLFFDDFQDGFSNWTESNEFDWNTEKAAERSVPGEERRNLVAHADNCDSYCVLQLSTSLDLSNYSNATLKFYRYVDDDIDNNEFLQVEAFNGTSWNTIFYWTNNSGNDNAWHYETFDLSNYLVNNFNLRFTSKENSTREEVEIDNVLIEVN
jgi:serine protease